MILKNKKRFLSKVIIFFLSFGGSGGVICAEKIKTLQISDHVKMVFIKNKFFYEPSEKWDFWIAEKGRSFFFLTSLVPGLLSLYKAINHYPKIVDCEREDWPQKDGSTNVELSFHSEEIGGGENYWLESFSFFSTDDIGAEVDKIIALNSGFFALKWNTILWGLLSMSLFLTIPEAFARAIDRILEKHYFFVMKDFMVNWDEYKKFIPDDLYSIFKMVYKECEKRSARGNSFLENDTFRDRYLMANTMFIVNAVRRYVRESEISADSSALDEEKSKEFVRQLLLTEVRSL